MSRLVFVAATCASLVAVGQAPRPGTLLFGNRITGYVDAPVTDTDGTTKLEGPVFLAQLYAGVSESSMIAADKALTLRTALAAGYIYLTQVELTNVPAGENAFCQMRAWDSTFGLSYETAKAKGGRVGESNIIMVRTGNAGQPPSLPTMMIGLLPFSLKPGINGPFPPDSGTTDAGNGTSPDAGEWTRTDAGSSAQDTVDGGTDAGAVVDGGSNVAAADSGSSADAEISAASDAGRGTLDGGSDKSNEPQGCACQSAKTAPGGAWMFILLAGIVWTRRRSGSPAA